MPASKEESILSNPENGGKNGGERAAIGIATTKIQELRKEGSKVRKLKK